MSRPAPAASGRASGHVARVLTLLFAVLALALPAVGAGTTCTDLGGTIEDISGSGSCSTSGSIKRVWYIDEDTDGYYASEICCCPTGVDCRSSSYVPDGYSSSATGTTSLLGTVDHHDYDCDEANASVNPGATEVCDSKDTDEDCNGYADDDDSGTSSVGKSVFYRDADADGYGDSTYAVPRCDGASGYTTNKTDCDDTDDAVNPGATEIVGDEIDEDCNGKEKCYIDTDGDGYRRDPSLYTTTTTTSSDSDCNDSGEASSALPATDCDDLDKDVNPGATEIAGDDEDEDCDGSELCYEDVDGDGYRTDATLLSDDDDCKDTGEALSTAPDEDCDDTDTDINPGEAEVCDLFDVDEDCDGLADDDDSSVSGQSVWYLDADLDGYGDADSPVSACDQPDDYVPRGDDCDDGDDRVYPGAAETWYDGVDEDCGGDDDYDQDGDGWVPAEYAGESTCDADGDEIPGTGELPGGDCDDADSNVGLGPEETWYDGVDEDCMGDDDYDQDGDGWVPAEYAGEPTYDYDGDEIAGTGELPGGDCDDTDAGVGLGPEETWYDGVDDDCMGDDDYDQDGDGYVPAEYAGEPTYDYDGDEIPGTGELPGDDCDDTDSAVNPEADDVWYDGVDTDCAGDDDYDQDGDGVVPEEYGGLETAEPDGDVVAGTGGLPAGDCDDTNPDVGQARPETWYDGLDADCAGDDDYDQDGDGYVQSGDEGKPTYGLDGARIAGTGTSPGGDCDDQDPATTLCWTVTPGAKLTCGCSSQGGSPSGGALLGAGLAWLLLRRRRRSAAALGIAVAGLLMLSRPASAGCPAAPKDVNAHALAARDAFARLDAVGFAAARDAMREEVGCLNAPMTADQVAAVHQTEALAWFQVQDDARTVASFQAMLESDSSWRVSDDVAPPGGPVHRLIVQATNLPRATRRPHGLPAGYTVLEDGVPADDLPDTRPSLVVILGPDPSGSGGRVMLWSGLVPAGGNLPTLGAVSQVQTKTDEAPPTRRPSAPARSERLVASLGYGAGLHSYAQRPQQVGDLADVAFEGAIAQGLVGDVHLWLPARLHLGLRISGQGYTYGVDILSSRSDTTVSRRNWLGEASAIVLGRGSLQRDGWRLDAAAGAGWGWSSTQLYVASGPELDVQSLGAHSLRLDLESQLTLGDRVALNAAFAEDLAPRPFRGQLDLGASLLLPAHAFLGLGYGYASFAEDVDQGDQGASVKGRLHSLTLTTGLRL